MEEATVSMAEDCPSIVESERAGASISHPNHEPEHEQLEGQPTDGDDLPMVVWLRGDEEIAEQFTLSADDAMSILGIRRSRLTQISGRELRVGRMRVDRYTRPVYRPVDIESYKQWTRASTSHLRSSSVVQQAANELQKQSGELAGIMSLSLREYSQRLESAIGKLSDETTGHYHNFLRTTNKITDDVKLKFFQHTQTNYEDLRVRLDDLTMKIANLTQRMQSIDELNSSFQLLQAKCDQMAESIDGLSTMHFESAAHAKDAKTAQDNFNRDVGKALSIVVQFLREGMLKHDKTLNALEGLQGQTRSAPTASFPLRRMAKTRRVRL